MLQATSLRGSGATCFPQKSSPRIEGSRLSRKRRFVVASAPSPRRKGPLYLRPELGRTPRVNSGRGRTTPVHSRVVWTTRASARPASTACIGRGRAGMADAARAQAAHPTWSERNRRVRVQFGRPKDAKRLTKVSMGFENVPLFRGDWVPAEGWVDGIWRGCGRIGGGG